MSGGLKRRTTSFGTIIDQARTLMEYLDSQELSPHPDSIIARGVESSERVLRDFQEQTVHEGFDTHSALTNLANVQALSTIVLNIRGTASEAELFPRLRLLTAGDPRLLSPGPQSEERDRVFELACWYVCSRFASHVEFNEPDVTCVYRGIRWGLACKAAYGGTQRIVKAIRKGWNQVLRADVEAGFVLVHLTNLFPHERMYDLDPETGIISSLHQERAEFEWLADLLRETSSPIEKALARTLGIHPKADLTILRGVLYLVHTLAYFRGHRTTMGSAVYQRMAQAEKSEAWAFVEEFNKHWQRW